MDGLRIAFEIFVVAITLVVGLYYGFAFGFKVGKQYMITFFSQNKEAIIAELFRDYSKSNISKTEMGETKNV